MSITKQLWRKKFVTNLLVENIYFSDHVVVGIEIQKDYVDFILIYKICYHLVRKKNFNCFLDFLAIVIYLGM